MSRKVAYSFDSQCNFVIEQYNDSAPLAGFLPGIAGVDGIPAWAFYVNRGQALASFGVRNKDGAMLEFYPADKAYQLTASRGFRTFLKIDDGKRVTCHEAFQRGAGDAVRQRLIISPHEVGVEETHPDLDLAMRVDMFSLPGAQLAGLVRRVSIQNTSNRAKTVEIVDGLPQILPYGLNQWCVKFMSRTIEAYMRVEGLAENCPFFRLKVLPTDTPQVEAVLAGNFFVGVTEGMRNPVLVDAEKVFGLAGDFSRPESFFSGEPLTVDNQVAGNQTPSAFQTLTLQLPPGATRVFYGLYGHVQSGEALQAFLPVLRDAQYFERKREENRRLVESLTLAAYTATAYPIFDAYARQCFLDNGMRGGFSVAVPGGKHLYLFGRKHGDLERDYNDFLLQDSPYSEGNGDFRDVLQNRRMDVFFAPALGAKNIYYFFNLIQPDGYNPLLLRNSRFIVEPSACGHLSALSSDLRAVLARPFNYAELWQALQSNTADIDATITQILRDAREVEDVEFDRGYWSDHWTYLLDLLESYAAIYPDRIAGLFHECRYSFYDPIHFVRPRSAKYVMTPEGLRQFAGVEERPEKRGLIASRTHDQHRVRKQAGKGAVVMTTLLGKILTLVVNKLASLDPYGVGMEMEADRPGWCDAMNGLPGLLGSAVNETIELKRLVDFSLNQLDGTGKMSAHAHEGDFCAITLPIELSEFFDGLEQLLGDPELTAAQFWQHSHDLKEAYRERVFMGFQGQEIIKPCNEVCGFLKLTSDFLATAIAKAMTAAGIVTYFAYEAEEYQLTEGAVDVTRFRQIPLPLFLEGFVHAMRIATPEGARQLYQAVCASELFDRKLGMFRVNVPLGDDALRFGRIGVFNYGWLENGSVFLHMHYKWVLEMARRGLIQEVYAHLEQLLIPFRNPEEYRRSTTENVSFLVSSGFMIDQRQHGRGCVARLSGSTVEFLHLWTHLFLGASPFLVENGQLIFRPSPSLSTAFFSTAEKRIQTFGEAEEILPRDATACALLGNTLLVYLNPQRLDTFGADAAAPIRFQLHGRDGAVQTIEAACLQGPAAEALRLGQFSRLDVWLGKY